MTKSPLADPITRTENLPNNTCVQYIELLRDPIRTHKLRGLAGIVSKSVGNQESKA
ncbi:hypothetical protein MAHJHV51_34440 [Mycobacterium avium subsp. hominissuis]